MRANRRARERMSVTCYPTVHSVQDPIQDPEQGQRDQGLGEVGGAHRFRGNAGGRPRGAEGGSEGLR